MSKKLEMTSKQMEYFKNANKRWNLQIGGIISGKKYATYRCFIPSRLLLDTIDKDGIILFLGYTKGAVGMGVIAPMQEIWGNYVSDISAKSCVKMFGKTIHVHGMGQYLPNSKISDILNNHKVKYVYGHEFSTWNEKMFDLLKANIEKHGGIFDGVSSSGSMLEWTKRFIKKEDDIFIQHYTMYDNPFLSDETKKIVQNHYSKEKDLESYNNHILGKY